MTTSLGRLLLVTGCLGVWAFAIAILGFGLNVHAGRLDFVRGGWTFVMACSGAWTAGWIGLVLVLRTMDSAGPRLAEKVLLCVFAAGHALMYLADLHVPE